MSKYIPVIQILLEECENHGFAPVKLFDGEDIIKNPTIADFCAVDEETLTVANKSGEKIAFFLVYGNELSETICDAGYSEATVAPCVAICKAIVDHFEN